MNPHDIDEPPTQVDPELLAEYTAGVLRARREYARKAGDNSRYRSGFVRLCPRCGKTFRDRTRGVCSPCRRASQEAS